uniref:5-formyltetrahydrofolate cyclo-ligase n=1 Tax=Parastrongyloides trichosuri TaxID=131310 RepID=A0A0N4ZZ20_PARTI
MNKTYEMRKRYLKTLEILRNKKASVTMIDKKILEGTLNMIQPNSEHCIISDVTKINFYYKDVCLRTSDISKISVTL